MNLLDIVLGVIILLFVVRGILQGLFKEGIGLAGIILGIVLGINRYQQLGRAISSQFGILSLKISNIIAFIIIFGGIAILGAIAGIVIHNLLSRHPLTRGVEKAGGFIIVGDDNYGEGSSREHAAMTPRFLGAKAVIAKSFARIHEVNLKKQGILPFTFQDQKAYDMIEQYDTLSIVGLNELKPFEPVTCIVKKKSGKKIEILLSHSLTARQIEWFKAGSALNTLREEVGKS